MSTKILIRGGHTETSTGASGLLNELQVDRKVYPVVIQNLKSLGYTVYNGTPPESYSYPAELNYGINLCNNNHVDYGVSIHLNSGGGKGAEVWISEYAQQETIDRANRVLDKLKGLGFNSRGIKRNSRDGRSLGEIRLTNMPFLIIELCFVDSAEDKAIVDRVGYEAIGRAIAEGLSGKQIEFNGWVQDNGWKYYENGKEKTGWIKDNNKWSYINPVTKIMLTGWLKYDDNWYYLKDNGEMATGWIQDKGNWYYLKDSGEMLKGNELNEYMLKDSGEFVKKPVKY